MGIPISEPEKLFDLTYALLRSLPEASLGGAERQSEGGTVKVLLSPLSKLAKVENFWNKNSEKSAEGAVKLRGTSVSFIQQSV